MADSLLVYLHKPARSKHASQGYLKHLLNVYAQEAASLKSCTFLKYHFPVIGWVSHWREVNMTHSQCRGGRQELCAFQGRRIYATVSSFGANYG